ncbi:hypothetical protein Dda_1969 [Drechslerella dactyloides]|uniref:Mid2 domain-containing protein n=1 Tax=Drechslerella dactyloides TaxID=74499 RepID=A0AAD6J3J1_DREDA|nr:hypothetical protein Dda_1969 [Drechslerella dactyloides]
MPAEAPSTTRWPSTSSLLCLLAAFLPAAVHAAAMQLPSIPRTTAITTTIQPFQTPQAMQTPPPDSSVIPITVDGTVTAITVRDCSIDTAQPHTAYTFIATVGENIEVSTVTDGVCVTALAKNSNGNSGGDRSSGLSDGALIGITLGVSIPVLAAVGFYFYRLLKQHNEKNEAFNAYHRKWMEQQRAEREAQSGNINLSRSASIEMPAPAFRPRDPDIVAPPGNLVTHISAGR